MTDELKDAERTFDKEQEEAAKMKEASKALVSVDNGINSMLMDSGKFTQALRAAQLLAGSSLVPQHFRGKENVGNCFIGLQLAARTGIDVFMVLQNLYVVHGRPGLQAKIMIAAANARGPFTGPIQWELEREGNRVVACTAFATHRKTGERCEYRITWADVQKWGWDKKPNSMWQTMPEKMFKYRSAAWLIDLYCPEVVMGLQSLDDVLDSGGEKPIEAEWAEVDNQDDPNADVPTDWPKQDDKQPADDPASPVQTEIKTSHGSTIKDKTGEPPPADGLTLSGLDDERKAAFMPTEIWNDQLAVLGINPNDGRTQTQARLSDLRAFLEDWKVGARE
jgi:hypothetical protein